MFNYLSNTFFSFLRNKFSIEQKLKPIIYVSWKNIAIKNHKKKDGNEIHKLSLSLILTIKPSSICKNRPNEETIKMGW